MRIYVLGCGGMLGDAVYKHFTFGGHEVLATDIKLTSPWVHHRDVLFYSGMAQDASLFHPDAIINLAAMTDLEECEVNEERAVLTNTCGSANCALLASTLDVPYVYISTAGIFDGEQEYYDEHSVPNPQCVYAKTKYYGELIAQTVPKHVVLRCGWQMGSGPKDKKFIQKIWQQIKAGAVELNVVTDKQGTPTYVRDFTEQIDSLLANRAYGLYNAVCGGEASRFDVAVEFVRLLGLQDSVHINIVPSSFWAKEFSAPRPASEKLLTSRLDYLGLNVMRPWREALAEYVTEYKEYFTL